MADIYFSKKKESLLLKVVRFVSFLLAKFSPFLSNKLAEKLFCSPLKVKGKDLDQGFTEESIEVLGSLVKVYLKGNPQKRILFSHGWSGHANNFSSFYDFYLSKGFGIITIDHIAHGKSEGRISNYFYFFETVKAVYVNYEQSIVGALGHSLGAAAILGAKLPVQVPLCLLAPPLSVFDFLFDKAKEAGISQLMIEEFLRSYEKRYFVNRELIDPKSFISKLDNRLCIFHCEDDEYICIKENIKHLNFDQKAKVNTLSSLGHFRILKSQEVVTKSLDFFNEAK